MALPESDHQPPAIPTLIRSNAPAAAVVRRVIGGKWDWRVCYQSRVGPMKWIGPSTHRNPEAVRARDGVGVIVVPSRLRVRTYPKHWSNSIGIIGTCWRWRSRLSRTYLRVAGDRRAFPSRTSNALADTVTIGAVADGRDFSPSGGCLAVKRWSAMSIINATRSRRELRI